MIKNLLIFLLMIGIMIGGSVAWYYQRAIKYYPIAALDNVVKSTVKNIANYRRDKVIIDSDHEGEFVVDLYYSILDETGRADKKVASIILVPESFFEEEALGSIISLEDKIMNEKVRQKFGKKFYKDRIAISSLEVDGRKYSPKELELLNTSLKNQEYKFPLKAPVPRMGEINYFSEMRAKYGS